MKGAWIVMIPLSICTVVRYCISEKQLEAKSNVLTGISDGLSVLVWWVLSAWIVYLGLRLLGDWKGRAESLIAPLGVANVPWLFVAASLIVSDLLLKPFLIHHLYTTVGTYISWTIVYIFAGQVATFTLSSVLVWKLTGLRFWKVLASVAIPYVVSKVLFSWGGK
jgi:hypothetical protein